MVPELDLVLDGLGFFFEVGKCIWDAAFIEEGRLSFKDHLSLIFLLSLHLYSQAMNVLVNLRKNKYSN